MTKKELVDQIAEKRGMSAQEVLSVVEDLMKLVKRNVAAGDSVYLRGFGVFQSRLRRAKVGRKSDGTLPKANSCRFRLNEYRSSGLILISKNL